MSKSISPALLAHKSSSASTLCLLQLIGPLPDASYVGLTDHDKDVVYNPSTFDASQPDVDQTFFAHTGTQLSTLSSANDLSVDNGESQTLVEVFPAQGITIAMVDSGKLDGVPYVVYLINYKDLTMGHEIMASGPIGEVRVQRGGLITFENRSWSQFLKQNSVCELDSLSCRVKKFGSQIGDERFPCGYDLSAEVVSPVAVTSVGAETVREFTCSALSQADDFFAPGLWVWTSGDNVGTSQEIETFTAGGVIALQFITRNPIQVGDMGHPRRDCTRQFVGHNGCEEFFDDLRGAHFRGEPFIPVSDTIALSVPGASL